MRVIAIDGPAGSGKSTLARKLAARLGLAYLDTGAMYRAVAFQALRCGLAPDDRERVAAIARELELHIGDDEVVVDGIDATAAIRGADVTQVVSTVAANPAVREEMRRRQRAWADDHGGGVIEGRDIGTVVFPDAELKVFLTAAPATRAERRAREMSAADYRAVQIDLARRDALDQGRDDSPLVEAPDAIVVDTTDRTVDEVVDDLLRKLER